MKVRDLMTPNVVTLDARSPLVSAEEIMGLRRVRHLPCLEDGRFVGLITHRDLLRAYLPGGSAVERAIHASKHKVHEFMHTDVQTVSPDRELTEAARLLRTHKWGCLPVVGEDGRLVGIVTDADFLHLAEVVIDTLTNDDPTTLQAIRDKMDKDVV